MLPVEKINKLLYDSERAQQDSRTLWREITEDRNPKPGAPAARDDDDGDSLPLKLSGRYQVGDGSEFPCEVRAISPLGFHLKGPRCGRVGDVCTANIATVGIVEGIVVQTHGESFVVGVFALPIRISRLAKRLRWQLRRETEELTDRRASERVEMNHATAQLETAEGRLFPCEIFDISQGGAALHLGSSALYFWVDQPIKMGGRAGRVLRYFPGGVVIKFD
ncbi:MAG: hypothetical protein KGM15_13885 [Pseudomonadota bacterium]|nr:hypothetical protein [Pseudomonadota bacterium]